MEIVLTVADTKGPRAPGVDMLLGERQPGKLLDFYACMLSAEKRIRVAEVLPLASPRQERLSGANFHLCPDHLVSIAHRRSNDGPYSEYLAE